MFLLPCGCLCFCVSSSRHRDRSIECKTELSQIVRKSMLFYNMLLTHSLLNMLNPLGTHGISHAYQLDESISNLRVVG